MGEKRLSASVRLGVILQKIKTAKSKEVVRPKLLTETWFCDYGYNQNILCFAFLSKSKLDKFIFLTRMRNFLKKSFFTKNRSI